MVASPRIIDAVVASMLQAATANLETPGRRGSIVALDDTLGDEILITADLHGNRMNFDALLAKADLPAHPRRHLLMQEVCHGGPSYPVGGACMSHLLLEDVAALKCRHAERFHFILSNHELAELIDYPIAKSRRMLNLQFRCGLQEMYGEDVERVRDAYRAFLRSCPLAVRLANGVLLCHSIPEGVDFHGFDIEVFDRELTDEDLQPGGAAFQLVWGRDFRPENIDAFVQLVGAKIIIQGHEPCQEGFRETSAKHFIIDSCSQPACYLFAPITEPLTHADARRRIETIH